MGKGIDFLISKRKELGLTQREFAEKIGVNLRMYAEYEQGRRTIESAHADTVYNIAKVLGCRMEDLIGEERLE